MVATRILYDGIHTGTCMGIPATGKRITFEALENFKVENGKITETWGYWPDKEIEQKLKRNNSDSLNIIEDAFSYGSASFLFQAK